jgi:integrase
MSVTACTIDKMAAAYIAARRDRAANTRAIDAKAWAALRGMPVKRVSQLTLQHVDTHVARRREGGASARTINMELDAAKLMISWAISRGMCESNPLAEWKPLRRRPVREKRAFKLEEVHSLLRYMPDEWKLLFRVYLCTGMRRGEALGLPWSEVDLEEAVITLGRSRTKTREKREVVLGPRIVDMLAALPRVSEYVFVNPRTGRPYNAMSPGRAMKKAAERAGWADLTALTPHALRRSFATIAWKTGADKTLVGKLLGHKGTLAEDAYIQVPLDDLRASAVKVEALILGGEE